MRHGHYAAIFVLANQSAFATRLERALLEQGFEVLHFDGRDASSALLLGAVHAAHMLGAILIYSGDAIATETKEKLAAGVTPAFFDLPQAREKFDDEELLQRALAAADSLRITAQANH